MKLSAAAAIMAPAKGRRRSRARSISAAPERQERKENLEKVRRESVAQMEKAQAAAAAAEEEEEDDEVAVDAVSGATGVTDAPPAPRPLEVSPEGVEVHAERRPRDEDLLVVKRAEAAGGAATAEPRPVGDGLRRRREGIVDDAHARARELGKIQNRRPPRGAGRDDPLVGAERFPRVALPARWPVAPGPGTGMVEHRRQDEGAIRRESQPGRLLEREVLVTVAVGRRRQEEVIGSHLRTAFGGARESDDEGSHDQTHRANRRNLSCFLLWQFCLLLAHAVSCCGVSRASRNACESIPTATAGPVAR